VSGGGSLDEWEAEAAFSALVAPATTSAEITEFLLALKRRGETAAELAGGVRALRKAVVPVELPVEGVIDTCGTGGGALTTFNISTAAALVAAGGGARVAKHGNRSYTSRSGSADVLEALGIAVTVEPGRLAEVLRDVGFVFLYAPALHPAMRQMAAVRRELGVATAMNLIGPLANPAAVRRQVVGVSDPDLLTLMAGALRELGHRHSLVVHGEPGMDELSPLGRTRCIGVDEGTLREFEVTPSDFGWSHFAADELAGGEPEDNARCVEEVLRGRRHGGARAAVVLNAAAAFYVAGLAEDLATGVARAEAVIDAGHAWQTVERLRAATPHLAADIEELDGLSTSG